MMKKILASLILISATVFGVVSAPSVVATGASSGGPSGTTASPNSNPSSRPSSTSGSTSTGSSSTGSDSSSGLCDEYPEGSDLWNAAGCGVTTTADQFANNIIKVVLSLVGVIAVGVMVYGGIMYTISTGDAAKVQRAKHIIMYGLIGLVVTVMAYAIVLFVTQMISAA